ncbi:hypothetical protein PAMA_011143 [Pampus argenteus]
MKCDTFKEYKKKLHKGEVRFRMRFPAKLRIETCEGERAFDCPQKATSFIDTMHDAVEVLQIGGKLDMDELYEEYCATLPRQQEIVERRVPVLEKWSLLLKGTKTPNLTAVASFLFGIPVTNASVERVFSLMGAAWTDQRNRCSVELIKSEIQVKTNFEYTCKEFYSYALKEKTLLEAARSSKKYKVKQNT